MKKRLFHQAIKLLLAASMAVTGLGGAFVRIAQANQPATFLHSSNSIEPEHVENLAVVQEGATSLVVELRTPGYEIQQTMAEEQNCQIITAYDYTQTDRPGWPSLPYIGAMAGIPLQGVASLAILEAEPIQIEGQFNLCPAPRPVIEIDSSGEIHFRGQETIRDQQAYSSDSYLPNSVAELSSIGFLRNQRIAQIRFNPFQYNPINGQVRYFKLIRVQLNYSDQDEFKPSKGATSAQGAFESIMQASILNYKTALRWRKPDNETQGVQQSLMTAPTEQNWYKLLVDENRIYRISYGELQAAGANLLGVDPNTFQIFSQGKEVAIQVRGDSDSTFDPEDVIIFYAEKINTKYTGTNVYWLTWGIESGKRIVAQNGTPDNADLMTSFLAKVHLEQNSLYMSSYPDSNDDNWYWNLINASSAAAYSNYSVTLNHVDAAAQGSARLRGMLKGYSASPQHHTKIYVNGNLVADRFWPSLGEYAFEVEFPMGYLLEGANTIKVESPRDNGITSDQTFANWFEVDYWKTFSAEQDILDFNSQAVGNWLYQIENFSSESIEVFDVSDPLSPVQITGLTVQSAGSNFTANFQGTTNSSNRYLALIPERFASPTNIVPFTSANLTSSQNVADYLLITHSSFFTNVLPLAEWRSSQGMQVKVIDVQSIYDEFNYGIFDPKAIFDFLTFAYQNWQGPSPQYVLLVGDGHYDYRDYKATNEPILIPPYLMPVDPWLNETASDNRYVTVNGDDNLPDMLIGRLPVKNSEEAATMVRKILDYEQTPVSADWNRNALFVTDNPDSAGDFYSYSDIVVNNFLPTGYTPQKVYYGRTHSTAASAKAAILNEINQGKLMVNYVGHGAMMQWASENLLNASSMPSLTNTGKLPFFVAMACMTGYFHYPSPAGYNYSSISEELVKASNRGAIASWASAGMGLASGQDYLNRGLYKALFYEGQTHLGVATLQAKLYLYARSTSYNDLIDTYTLFGDPALKLKVRPADLSVQLTAQPTEAVFSGEPITYTLTFNNLGQALATYVRVELPLPEAISNIVVENSGASITPLQENTLTWDTANLAPGEGGVIIIKGVVNVESTHEITSQAGITSAIIDAVTSNNTTDPIYTVAIYPDDLITEVSALQVSDSIELSWRVATEVIAVGYNIYRSEGAQGQRILLNNIPTSAKTPGNLVSSNYSFLDTSVTLGQTYHYWVEMVGRDGETAEKETFISTFIFLYLPSVLRMTN